MFLLPFCRSAALYPPLACLPTRSLASRRASRAEIPLPLLSFPSPPTPLPDPGSISSPPPPLPTQPTYLHTPGTLGTLGKMIIASADLDSTIESVPRFHRSCTFSYQFSAMNLYPPLREVTAEVEGGGINSWGFVDQGTPKGSP